MNDVQTPSKLNEEGTSRFVQTRRWKLHYNEAGSGFPVIMLHGTGPGATGWSNFHQNMAALSATNRVILLDFPGWGRSDAFDCSGEARNVANALAVKLLMDELGIERAALVGNSMGGAAVLQFMAEYPERISHAITMGSGLFGLPNMIAPGGQSEGIRIIVETYRDPTPANFKRLVAVMVYDSSFATDALAAQRSKAALATPEHLANWLKSFMRPVSQSAALGEQMARLPQSKIPTLMIHGRDDRTVSLEATLKTACLIPNCRSVIFNRCGHWAQVEHAAEFNRLLLGFLGQFSA